MTGTIVDIRFSEERDINTLFSYLENLHSTADKLKDNFHSNIKDIPEFKLLRVIRNYFHHVEDIDELRFFVALDKQMIVSHAEHIIIPLELFAKSLKSFIDNNTVKKTNKKYQKKMNYVASEIASICLCCDCHSMIAKLPEFCDSPQLNLDGIAYSLGFDLFKFVYNITNIIADECRGIKELRIKEVVKQLDSTYSSENNIEVNDLICHPSITPILTIEGYIFANEINQVI